MVLTDEKFNHACIDYSFAERNEGDESYVFQFENGYGASVVKRAELHNAYEVAVLNSKGDVIFDTPVTDDVERCQSDSEVEDLLNQIKNLKGCESHA